jgi:hypothetical protein
MLICERFSAELEKRAPFGANRLATRALDAWPPPFGPAASDTAPSKVPAFETKIHDLWDIYQFLTVSYGKNPWICHKKECAGPEFPRAVGWGQEAHFLAKILQLPGKQ